MPLCGECNTEADEGSTHCLNCGGASWVEDPNPTKRARSAKPEDDGKLSGTGSPPAPPATGG